jgi:3-phenylpropionate/trans-cinnamate dioxygenase ferredoxin reductase subunit
LVVGAGTAGGTFAALLRQAGFSGEVMVIGAEPHLPYHRPPLSKKFTEPLADTERWLRAPEFYADQSLTMCLDESAVALDTESRVLTTDRGRSLDYDVVVLATGARPRRLLVPGAHLDGVLTLRTLSDAERLREAVAGAGPLVVVGGGYVGLEVAAVATSRGVPVTVVERESRLLARVASPVFASILADQHGRRGTSVRTGVEVTACEGTRGQVTLVYLSDGSALAASAVVVGVGAEPCDGLARAAGLACADGGGVIVDEAARTTVPGVLAIGDVTVRPCWNGAATRLESIPSAIEQAKQAVATVCGTAVPPSEVPWFWSDQFDLKLKIAGQVRPPFETVIRDLPGDGSFAVLHHVDGVPMAVETANANADFMAGRRMVAARRAIDPERWTDPAVPLRELAFA